MNPYPPPPPGYQTRPRMISAWIAIAALAAQIVTYAAWRDLRRELSTKTAELKETGYRLDATQSDLEYATRALREDNNNLDLRRAAWTLRNVDSPCMQHRRAIAEGPPAADFKILLARADECASGKVATFVKWMRALPNRNWDDWTMRQIAASMEMPFPPELTQPPR